MPGISYAAAGALSGFVVQIYANSLRRIPALRRMPPRPAPPASPRPLFLFCLAWHPSPPCRRRAEPRPPQRGAVGAAPCGQHTGRRIGGLCIAPRELAHTGSIILAASHTRRPLAIRPHAVAARLKGRVDPHARAPGRTRALGGCFPLARPTLRMPAGTTSRAGAGEMERRLDGRLTFGVHQ
jgi:hypothetical protein